MLDSMRIKASKANIEVYYKGNLLLEANPMDFVLNYDKEWNYIPYVHKS